MNSFDYFNQFASADLATMKDALTRFVDAHRGLVEGHRGIGARNVELAIHADQDVDAIDQVLMDRELRSVLSRRPIGVEQ